MKKFLFLIGVLFLFVQQVNSQGFINYYGDICADAGLSICENNSGGYLLFGHYEDPSSSDCISMYVISIDSAGNQEWDHQYGGPLYDFGQSIDKTSDGGYILFGFTSTYGAGGYDAYLVKIDGSGNQEWQQTFGGTDNEYGYCVKQTFDGGYILCGSTYSFGAGGTDAFLIKTDAAGNALWTKYFGGTANDGAYALAISPDSGYILAGYTYNFGSANGDAMLLKTDTGGNQQWLKTYGGSSSERALSVVVEANGNYVFSGYTNSFGAGSEDYYLLRTDSAGNILQDTTFGGFLSDESFGISICSDKGFVLTGYTNSFGNGGRDLYIVKTDSAFNFLWDSYYGGTQDDQGVSIIPTNDNGYITLGESWSISYSLSDIYVVKTDSNGVATAVTKYSPNHKNIKVYPQPAVDFIDIETGFPMNDYTVSIFDAAGKLFSVNVVSDPISRIDVSKLPAGIYILKAELGNKTVSGRFVKE